MFVRIIDQTGRVFLRRARDERDHGGEQQGGGDVFPKFRN